MKKRKTVSSLIRFIFVVFIIVGSSLLLNLFAFADTGNTVVSGQYYQFNEDSNYEVSQNTDSTSTNEHTTCGNLTITADINNHFKQNDVPAYQIKSGDLYISYKFNNALLTTDPDEWHLVEDKSKEIDMNKLSNAIAKGAILVQTSRNGSNNWVTVASQDDFFSDNSNSGSILYNTKHGTESIELINGCYYRVIVAYKISKRNESSNFLFINTDKYDTLKIAEVYTFYACAPSTKQQITESENKRTLGKAVRVEQFKGYYGEKPMEIDDPHYGIEIGEFFVSGFTDSKEYEDEQVFLKNVGDKVSLWFNLKENINAIGGNESITITPDNNGHDQDLQTERTDFGRGALIIKKTNYDNTNSSKPQIYSNFLEANTEVGANTKIDLCEEGDYEVALDYEITEDKLIDSEGHYRIFFKFKIRNGNCMVYPLDLKTNAELSNSSLTENGFKLDLAKSRYLTVTIKREVLKDSADGLVEDTRFNGSAKDGAEYREEGIYTISVKNKYTEETTTKKIYVGTNDILRAHMVTGRPIPEINNMVKEGAVINPDGTIQIFSLSNESEEPSDSTIIPGEDESIQETPDVENASTIEEANTAAELDAIANEEAEVPNAEGENDADSILQIEIPKHRFYIGIVAVSLAFLILILRIFMLKRKVRKYKYELDIERARQEGADKH